MESTTTIAEMSIEEMEDFILERLPRVLERDPRFVTFIEGIVAERYPRRDEFAALINELSEHRKETAERFDYVDAQFRQVDERFERVEQRLDKIEQNLDKHDEKFDAIGRRFDGVDQRFDSLEQPMEQGFHDLHVAIDRLGAHWGIRNESIFRQPMREILEQSFGATVEERHIAGEQFDCVIIDGAHILVEISASVGRDILKKLQRKRHLYIDETGVTPARVLLAVGSIHSRRANALCEAGFEVIEPETDEEV